MKQLLQDLSNGKTIIADGPSPVVTENSIIIETVVNLISSGTERSIVDFGRSSLIDKALKQPDRVKQVFEKINNDGLFSAVDSVTSKLNQPIPLGYSNVGVVKEVGSKVKGFLPGERVLSNGFHADIVRVPKNLCVKIPDNVSDDSAVFGVVGSIALQGVRLANPQIGETAVVIGAGLVGLLTVQVLIANGCSVIAIDFDEAKLKIAQSYGASIINANNSKDVVSDVLACNSNGADLVVITASTKSSDPVSQAARMSRKRGRIILTGVTGLELNRAEFYEKELSFQVSCSYGPGRYDNSYEVDGIDYPYGFVRWTENRNMEAILNLIKDGKLQTEKLIDKRFNFDQASKAYAHLLSAESSLGILLDHDASSLHKQADTFKLITKEKHKQQEGNFCVSFFGAGNYASRVLIPSFKKNNASFRSIMTTTGISGSTVGKNYGFETSTTSEEKIFNDDKCSTVVIATRHNTHSDLVVKAIHANKHIFVEKPLAINKQQIADIKSAIDRKNYNKNLIVGFNRRHSPHIQQIKKLLQPQKQPKSFIYTINAGKIDKEHWTQKEEIGGGRVIGEACHFIDLLLFLSDSKIISIDAKKLDNGSGVNDCVSILIGFMDGSIGTINYFSNGPSNYPKERLEIFCDGSSLELQNFKSLKGYKWRGFRSMSTWKQDKGHDSFVKSFISSVVKGTKAPIDLDDIFSVSEAAIEVDNIVKNKL